MLHKLREMVTSWIGIVILGLAIFGFSFFGIEGYFSAQTDTFAAQVNGQDIAQQTLQKQVNRLRARARQTNPNVDQARFSTPEFKRQVLDGLVNRELLRQANENMGVTVTDAMVAKEIGSIQAFQLNGAFDADTYKAVLGQQGLTPLGFQQQVRQDLSTQVLPNVIAVTAVAPAGEVDAFLRLTAQTRDVAWLTLPKPKLVDKTVTDAQAKAWYDEHPDAFAVPEKVTMLYVDVNAEDMQADTTVSAAELQAKYDKEKAKFTTPEQREVSHILVAVPDNATPAQQKAALAKADKIEAKLKTGADFATLAKKVSDDLGSKRQGGELGWIEKGMTDPAFESALFAMHKGEVSKPVLSLEGYHIIWLQGIRPGKAQSLAEVKDQLTKELLSSSRDTKYREIASKLTDMIYSNPGSLAKVAKQLGLTVQTTQPFSRAGGAGIATNPAVVKMAFSDQVLKQDMTSDPVNIAAHNMVVMHMASHSAATTKPLAKVRDEVKKQVLAHRAEAQAHKQAQALLAKLAKDATLESVAKAQGVKVKTADKLTRMSRDLPPKLRTQIFKMPAPTAKAATRTLVDLGSGSYALVALKTVHPGDPAKVPAARRKAVAMQLQRLHAQAERRGIVDILRRNAEIKFPKNPGGPA